MKSAQYVISCLCLCAAAHLSFADTHVWVGGNSSGGGWNTPSNWTNEQGVAECPSANDTVVFNQWNQTNVVTDADFDLFNSVKHVNLAAWSWQNSCGQVLELSFSEDRTINCRISGSGRLVVGGSHRIEFDPRESGGTKTGNGYYATYYLSSGGIVVKDSATLVLAQTKFDNVNGFVYGHMTIGADATVIAASNLNYNVFETLRGDGTLRRDPTPNWGFLQIGWSGNYSAERADFGGKITGEANLINYSNQAFTGTESDLNGYLYTCTGYGRTRMDRGWVYVKKLGTKSQPSSIGAGTWLLLGYGGNLGYLGNGETTDRDFTFEGREQTGLYPQYIDGGARGDLELAGELRCDGYGSEYNQRSVVFDGSNSTPCVVSGPYKMNFGQNGTNYHFYTRKEGSGTWEFRKNASSSYGGVFDIREGTLRFDSIAEVGMNCALGKATRLTREYTGKYKKEYDSPYAIRLGTTNRVGAADAVLEFNGASSCSCTTRPLLLTGNGHLRASGSGGAALVFGGISATAGAKTLVIDGASTAENTLMNVADGDGVVSVAKEGAGTWLLDGDHTFSGDLAVNGGTLKILGDRAFRYFRVTFWDNVFNHPNGSYVNEFGMYAADGTRVNRGLSYVHPAGYTDSSKTYTIAANRAATLNVGEICWDYIPGVSQQSVWDYTSNGATPDKLFDGTSSSMQFILSLYNRKYTLSMRLADDVKEVAYVDFIQNTGNYQSNLHPYARQTGSAFTVEGSLDGMTWRELVTTNTLADFVATNAPGDAVSGYYKIRGSGSTWFFSDSGATVGTYPDARTVGNGEGLPLTARAAIVSDAGEMLKNVHAISVATGATLAVEGTLAEPLTISRLAIDGAAGAGTISGIDFAPNMTVDVTGIPSGTKTLNLPVDFTGVTNFDNVASWTFLKDGAPTTRYRFELSKTGLKIDAAGLMLIVK